LVSFVYTGGERLTLTGNDIELHPARLSYTTASLSLSGGSISFSGAGVVSTSVSAIRLDRLRKLQGGESNNRGSASLEQFRRFYNDNSGKTEDAVAALVTAVTDIQAALDTATQAQQSAQEANTTANAVKAQDALKDSYTSPVGVLSAASDGEVTIAAHDRVYTDGDMTTVAVNSGSVSGFSEGDYVYVTYLDADRAGGAVTYSGTTSSSGIAQVGNMHIVGTVTIPAAGDPPATGGGEQPPGRPPPANGGYD
jgi:hypothetical protein